MKLGDIEFLVKIGEKKLEEYDTTIRGNEVNCWVPSEEGKNFNIRCINDSPDQAIVCAVKIDGRDADQMLLNPGTTADEWGVWTASDTLLPYVFSRIQLSDDDTLHEQCANQAMVHLGSIRLAIYRIKTEEDRDPSEPWRAPESVPQSIGPVHERSKKVVHIVSL
ncbi:hypothetical protein PHLGIDRAFT_425040 [Phlebiopsis gigantea 11061_1 CR5-6]|uniref:DUF7918 domain-containing protein n=1 Tax=Phlebiopsis gigantea (strain 11061_1 CR5-6) TaxID=745531 RepID=A0A0C3NQ28_PHLG1|nr:hypothetical protein PHLGIDRAFT_425040 [Phlebiopsis gigantea 11061_1 CR5-6]